MTFKIPSFIPKLHISMIQHFFFVKSHDIFKIIKITGMTQAPRIILVNSLGEQEQELSVLLLFRIATLGGGMPGGVKVYQVQEVVGGFLPKITADLKSPQRNR